MILCLKIPFFYYINSDIINTYTSLVFEAGILLLSLLFIPRDMFIIFNSVPVIDDTQLKQVNIYKAKIQKSLIHSDKLTLNDVKATNNYPLVILNPVKEITVNSILDKIMLGFKK